MLNFENPPPEEELDDKERPAEESGDLRSNAKVEFPRAFHHAAEQMPEEPELLPQSAPTAEKEEAEEVVRHPFTRKKEVAPQDERKAETSRILFAARNAAGLTQVDVEERTKVRAFYVEALENGNFDQLPQQVYVLAYLRRLAELYGITGEELNALLEPWKDIPCEIPENLPASVYPDPDNPNRKTLHRLEIILYTAGGILAVAVVALVIMLISSWLSGTRKAGNPPFDREVLLELQPTPTLTAPAQPKAK